MILRANSAAAWPLADNSVQCIVTSPPYWGLRDYGVVGQLGSERTVQEYVESMVAVFAEAWRVLREDGTLWLNLGDCYNAGTAGARKASTAGKHGYWENPAISRRVNASGLKPKDLIGVPWRVAFALQAAGWWLRSDIIWHKPNPMPESVTDRPTRAHEYVFLLTKAERYYYDNEAVKEGTGPARDQAAARRERAKEDHKSAPTQERNGMRRLDKQRGHSRRHAGFSARWDGMTVKEQAAMGRNKRSVWSVACRPARDGEGEGERHFAAYPPELVKPCILAGCPRGGIVLDPFAGTGTTVYTAMALGRAGLGLELNPAYARVAQRNLSMGPLFEAERGPEQMEMSA